MKSSSMRMKLSSKKDGNPRIVSNVVRITFDAIPLIFNGISEIKISNFIVVAKDQRDADSS